MLEVRGGRLFSWHKNLWNELEVITVLIYIRTYGLQSEWETRDGTSLLREQARRNEQQVTVLLAEKVRTRFGLLMPLWEEELQKQLARCQVDLKE